MKPPPILADDRQRPPPLIGWREWAGLPDLGVEKINAKIDTGAKSSAIHAFGIKETTAKGAPCAEFRLHPAQGRKEPELFCRAPIRGRRVIRSSNGREEERLVVRTRLQLAGAVWRIDLTLANRDAMDFRLLIGRDALGDRFLIRPDASYMARK